LYIRCVDRTEVISRLKSEAVTPSTFLFLTVNFNCKNMQEVWMPVVGYEGLYQVSNLGNVKSLPRNGTIKTERILIQQQNGYGYLHVGLRNNGLKTKHVHRLVADAFLNYIAQKGKIVIDHLDNNKLNNRLDNLQIISHRENISKDRKNNTGITGVRWSKYHNKFIAQIGYNNKNYHLGCFDCKYEAHLVYQNKLKEVININKQSKDEN
jgi:hypothetical protein